MHDSESPEKIVWSSCNVNCGSRCPLRLHVKDGWDEALDNNVMTASASAFR